MDEIEYTGRDNLEVMQEAKNYNKFLLDLVLTQVRNKELTVDFGAGCGTFALPIYAANHRLICVETDPVLAATLSRKGLTVVKSLNFFEDESIDYIYSINVLEHIEHDDLIIKLWIRKLRPGGSLIVYVPAFQELFSSMDMKVGHYRRYKKRTLELQLKQAGFQVIHTKYADSLGYLATFIYKVFDKGDGTINLPILKIYDKWIFPLSRLIDIFCFPFIGKNVYALAKKKLETPE